MPIYEYRCSRCGHELEALQKITDARLSTCPACNEAALVKKMSAAGFHLKGSGWYATDFRSSGSKPAADADAAKSEAAKSDAPKSDTAKSDVTKSETSKSGVATSNAEKSGDAKPSSGAGGDSKVKSKSASAAGG